MSKNTKEKNPSYYNADGSVKQEIYVDRDMKICEKRIGARRAIYNEEFDLYVVDTPGLVFGR